MPKTPYEHLSQQFSAMRFVAKVVGLVVPRVREQWNAVEGQFKKLEQIRMNIALFSHRYTPLGWVNFDRMSTDVLGQLETTSVSEGEEILTEYHLSPVTLQVLGYRFKMSQFQPWGTLYERAIERCEARDWLSAVPLLLIVIDGICATSTGKHPFSGGADAEVFDTQTSGPGGLSDGMRVLGAVRRKLSEEKIEAPFRHGIVHGLNPNFGHPIVVAKALNLLQATTDYFIRIKDESHRIAQAEKEQRPASWKQIAEQLRTNAEVRSALDAWEPRQPQSEHIASSAADAQLNEALPEASAAGYLTALAKSNYGAIASLTVDYPLRPLAYRAGRLRNDLKGIKLTHWIITSVNDVSPGMTDVGVQVTVMVRNRSAQLEAQLSMTYADENFEPLVRGATGGRWYATPKFTTDLWVHRQKLDGSSYSGNQA